MLEKLDQFLKRIEPEIESITGEERDTASFMKMMRLFNEVCRNHKYTCISNIHMSVVTLELGGQGSNPVRTN